MSEKTYRDFSDFDSGYYAPSEDFEGVLESHDPNGQLLFRGEFEKGEKRVGLHIAYWDNGNVKEVSYWADGWICGTQLWFDQNGTLETERFFGESGGKKRRWIERHYAHMREPGNEALKVWSIEVYENDELLKEWTDEDIVDSEAEARIEESARLAIKKFFPEFDLE